MLGYNNNLMKLEYELEHVSRFTCEKCGKQPLKNGEHIIWTSKTYWIENLCKECVLKKSSEETLNEDFEEISDDNKITIQVYDIDNKWVKKSWNPWKNYKEIKL